MRGAREANGSVTVAERNEEIADLVRRAQAGDRRAFDALFSLHETLALRVAFLITTDVELARDATQEAFLRAYRQIRSLRDPAAFRAWFARIVSTTSQRMAHQASRRLTAPLDESLELPAADPGPIEVSEWRDLQRRLRQALVSLSPVHRTVIALAALGHTEAEIARILRCPRGTVKSRLHFARRRLGYFLAQSRGWETVP